VNRGFSPSRESGFSAWARLWLASIMANIRVNKLQPGMTLSVDVKDSYGRVLLRGGASLTEKHITMLKAWGVAEISIRDEGEKENPPPAPDVDPKRLARVEAEVRSMFRFADMTQPPVKELFDLCVSYQLKQLS
jgi:hypothetical protein